VLGSGVRKQARGRLPGLDILQLSWNLGLVVNVAVLGLAASIAYPLARMSSGWRQRASGGAVPSLACRGHLFPPRGPGQARPHGRSGTAGGLAVRLGCHRAEESGHLRGGAAVLGSGALKQARGRLPGLDILQLSWNPGLVVGVAVLGLAASIAYALVRMPIGSGDYGQWLMLSRFYSGQDVPDYRHALAAPPVVPLLLAAIRVLISDPVVALQALRGILGAAFVLSFYLAGTAIFRQRVAGFLSAVIGFLVTDRLLELFAFGGLPQIAGLTFMVLGIAAFAQAGSSRDPTSRWWLVGSLGIALAVLSHTSSATIALAGGPVVAVISTLRLDASTWRERMRALKPFAMTLAVVAAYWLVVLLRQNQEYAQNPASLNYRGPDRIWPLLTTYWPTTLVLVTGAAALFAGGGREVLTRRVGGFVLVAAWTLSTLVVLAWSIMFGVATDYPRFVAPIVAPLAIAAGGGLAFASAHLTNLLPRALPGLRQLTLPLLVAVALAASVGPSTIGAHDRETSFYALEDLPGLEDAAFWLDAHLASGESVLAPAREGKWIEGLTGRAALFSMPTRYSFRSKEWNRSAAAETLLRSSASLANEFLFVKFPNTGGAALQDPWISINHGGEYVELVRLPPTLTKITLSSHGDVMQVTLAELTVTSVETSESEDSVEIRAAWGGKVRGATVLYKRTVRLARGSKSVDVTDEVTSSLPITALEAEVRPILKEASPATVLHDDSGEFIFPKLGKTQPRLEVSAPVQPVSMKAGAANSIVVRAAKSARLDLQLSAPEPGEPVYGLGLLMPDQLVEEYDVGGVLLVRDSTLNARMKRLSALGFSKKLELNHYVVMLHDADTASEVTP